MFLFFDDFEETNLNSTPDSEKWSTSGVIGAAYIQVKANPSGSGKVTDIYDNCDGVYTTLTTQPWSDSGEVAIGFKWMTSLNGNWWNWWNTGNIAYKSDGSDLLEIGLSRLNGRFGYWDGSAMRDWNPQLSYSINKWYDFEFKCLSGSASVVVNGTSYGLGYESAWGSPVKSSPMNRCHSEPAGHDYVDNFYVRKLVSPEPAITGYGQPTLGTLTVTSPNGGEVWLPGKIYTITWSRTGSTGSYVIIELLERRRH